MTPGVAALLLPIAWAQIGGSPNVSRLAPTTGLVMSVIEHGQNGEREALTSILDANSSGVRYGWSYRDVLTNGDTIVGSAARFVSTADLASAPRVHFIYDPKGPVENPGTTAWSVSSAVYQQLVTRGSAELQIISAEPRGGAAQMFAGFGFAGGQLVPVRWRGTLTRVAAKPELFPLLVNGQRVSVPAVRARGQFSGRGQQWAPEFWMLADSSYPMLLRVLSVDPPKEMQVVRVDAPNVRGAGLVDAGSLDRALASTCRVELPGVYFAFNSAQLDPVSDRALASVGEILARHRDWTVIVEGHTDSIGDAAANKVLSERRAAAVRERLIGAHRIAADRLRSAGQGAQKPREPNGTIEGRARNRRVELVRDCGGRQ
jgi:outer membrane protein OmpA-like peptidoglycan-associated protein